MDYELYPHQKKALESLLGDGKIEFYVPQGSGKTNSIMPKPPRNPAFKNAYYFMYGRQHKKKRWMSDTYHNRIQKKWNKRYGVGMYNVKLNTGLTKAIEETIKLAPGEKLFKQNYGSYIEQRQSECRILRPKKPVELIEFTPELLEKLKPNFSKKENNVKQ